MLIDKEVNDARMIQKAETKRWENDKSEEERLCRASTCTLLTSIIRVEQEEHYGWRHNSIVGVASLLAIRIQTATVE